MNASIRDIPETLSYVPFAIMDDGEALCAACVRDESNPIHAGAPDDGWRLIGWEHSGNVEADDSITCGHCGRTIVERDDS